jgi:hypothetical protein
VVEPVPPQPLLHLSGQGTAHLQLDAAVLKGAGQLADLGDGDRRPGRELARLEVALVLDHTDDGTVPGVAAVEHPAQFLVLGQEGVGLVHEQGRPLRLDGAEDRRRGDVRGLQGLGYQAREQVEHGGLAAALLHAGDGEPGGDEARLEGIGVHGPEGELGRPVRRQGQIAVEGLRQPVE